MQPFSKSSGSLPLRLLGVIVCAALLVDLVQARAKADFFDDSDDDDSWNLAWEEDDPGKENASLARSGGNEAPSDANDHSNHHSPPVLAAAASLGAQGAPNSSIISLTQGTRGGNFAAYNESCGPIGKSCARDQELVCSQTDETGRCICTEGHVYVRQTETCWDITKSDQDPCAHDVQCQAGMWGDLSRCNKHTVRCECFDFETNGKREMIHKDRQCYIRKSIGDLCTTHEECDKTVLGGAYCKEADPSNGQLHRSCQCRDTHLYWGPFKACLPFATKQYDQCKITEQCTAEGALGLYSRCSPTTATCECYSPLNGTEVVYYEKLHRCFKSKNYNDTCTHEDQCKASLGPDVECGITPGSPEENVCHCPEGRVCTNAGFSTILASPLWTIGLAAVAGVTTVMNECGLIFRE